MNRFLVAAALSFGLVLAAAAPPALAAPSTTGSWSAPFTPAGPTSRVIGVHSVLLHTGKVLLFGRQNPTVGYVYDPATGTTVETDPPANIECAAVVPLVDGRILAVGGIAPGNVGIKNILLFNPVTLTWTAQPSSPLGRYYPTATRLADDRVVISGGTTVTGAPNDTVEVYTPPPAGSSVGTLTRVADHHSAIYPKQYLLPDGKVLEVLGSRANLLNPATWTWTPLPSPSGHGAGQTVALLPGSPSGSTKVIVAGGLSTSAVAKAETFDESTPTVTWQPAAPLPQARAHMAAAWTPDGKLIGVGGNSMGLFDGAVRTALSYDPVANSWTTLAPQAERRAYHSTAVLLPDGRVLSAGDTGPGGGGNTNEIFSPPYLFKGSRPTITSMPDHVARGTAFAITSSVGSRAVLMSPGASTHTSDMNGRIIQLSQTATSSGIRAIGPANNVAPNGWYMLFVINSDGVPSIARWVHLD
jgi:hypothetical protein